jgi:hypothetical protein
MRPRPGHEDCRVQIVCLVSAAFLCQRAAALQEPGNPVRGARPPSAGDVNLFSLRAGLWLIGFGALSFCWGICNGWPVQLFAAAAFIPAYFLLGLRLYQRHTAAFEPSTPSEWEALVAFLLLATGVASGTVLLISLGWVSIGALYLRPRDGRIPPAEWFKLLLVFLFAFPIWQDVAGSRYDLSLGGRMGSLTGETNGLAFQILFSLLLVSLAFLLRGLLFWLVLPAPLAAFLVGIAIDRSSKSGLAAGFEVALLGLGVGAGLVLTFEWRRRFKGNAVAQEQIARAVFDRTYSTWLAVVVIVLQQSALVEGWLAGVIPGHSLLGMLALAGLLLGIRLLAPEKEVEPTSRVLLVAALFTLLAAEWIDLNLLRQLSLGLLLIGLFSWQRAWGWSRIAGAILAWSSVLPGAAHPLEALGGSPQAGWWIRLGMFVTGIALMLANHLPWPRRVHPASPAEPDWQPVKRFAFVLLSLLVIFQTASALWPETPGQTRWLAYRGGSSRSALLDPGAMLEWERLETAELDIAGQPALLLVALPPSEPVRLRTAEWTLERQGWRIAGRRILRHPRGLAVSLQLARGTERATGVYWFDQGTRTFAGPRRARRILWSAWNLSRRDLRLVLAISSGGRASPETLIEAAEGLLEETVRRKIE